MNKNYFYTFEDIDLRESHAKCVSKKKRSPENSLDSLGSNWFDGLIKFYFMISLLKIEIVHNQWLSPGGYFHIRRSAGLALKFASEFRVEVPHFASKNVGNKYPKFCPLNFRHDRKIRIFFQLLHIVVTEIPKFFLLFGELG